MQIINKARYRSSHSEVNKYWLLEIKKFITDLYSIASEKKLKLRPAKEPTVNKISGFGF